ncbi:hypothetical protein [Collinsella vaginalis]|uniref:hypothetical protein n=1 Tax=Collinsella vaginalis TaxID=1870987 RepID=UPI000A26F503|nr:hypothetical protein [Collinsella vaginalis]
MPTPLDPEPAPAPAHLRPVLDLMARDGISEAQIQSVMASYGYMTPDTPITAYDEEFAGWVASSWDQIRDYIRSIS